MQVHSSWPLTPEGCQCVTRSLGRLGFSLERGTDTRAGWPDSHHIGCLSVMPLTQGDHLMAAKASRQASGNHGARDPNYALYDNDDDNSDPALNSSSAAYFHNLDTSHLRELHEDRWKLGGGIDAGPAVGLHAGRTRDTDGTIDRVKDPPKELLPLLHALRVNCSSYNIELPSVFLEAGGSRYGTIPTTRFRSALVVALHRMNLSEETLTALASAYGCGTPIATRSAYSRIASFDSVAWADFCEDVEKAQDVSSEPYPYPGGPASLVGRR